MAISRPDNNCSVLLVEDNKAHADLLKICMKDDVPLECVSHVYDGEEALDFMLSRGIYSQKPAPYLRLVILDLRLPKADGIEILKNIRSTPQIRHIPVVIMSSSESPSDIKAAYENNANSYVVKSVDFDEFKASVTSIALYWLNYNKYKKDKVNDQ